MWKLSERGYIVRHAGAGYIVTDTDGTESPVNDLAALVAFADAVYDRVWIGRAVTPSA